MSASVSRTNLSWATDSTTPKTTATSKTSASSASSGSRYYVPMTREQAWELLCEFTKSDNLRRHALAVEACVTAYARKFGEDENKWSVTALLHDFDWEIHPELPDHPIKGEPILAERGVDEEIRRAILSHADFTGVPRVSMLRSEEHTSKLQSRRDLVCRLLLEKKKYKYI